MCAKGERNQGYDNLFPLMCDYEMRFHTLPSCRKNSWIRHSLSCDLWYWSNAFTSLCVSVIVIFKVVSNKTPCIFSCPYLWCLPLVCLLYYWSQFHLVNHHIYVIKLWTSALLGTNRLISPMWLNMSVFSAVCWTNPAPQSTTMSRRGCVCVWKWHARC